MMQLILLALVATATVNGYDFIDDMDVSWDQAQSLCMSRFGVGLAKVETQAHLYEIASVTQTWPELKHVWIGARKNPSDTSSFTWTDNTPVQETFFKQGEPNSGTSELCVHMWLYTPPADLASKQVWNDAQCSSSSPFRAACGFGTWTTLPPTAAPTTTPAPTTVTPTTTPAPTTATLTTTPAPTTAAPTTTTVAPTTTATPTTTPAPTTATPTTTPAPTTAAPATTVAPATTATPTTTPAPTTVAATTAAALLTTSEAAVETTAADPVTTTPAESLPMTTGAHAPAPGTGLLLRAGGGVNFGDDGVVNIYRDGDFLDVAGNLRIDGMEIVPTLQAMLAEIQQLRTELDGLRRV